jgi:hypothetical protein
MKNTFFHVSRAAALAICAIATSQVYGAIVPGLSVKVPFDFVVAGKTLPAGDYTIVKTNSTGGIPVFTVTNTVTRRGVLSMMSGRTWPADNEPKDARVIFACRDESCFMKELRIPGSDGYVVMLPKATRAQRESEIALNARYLAVGK